jgi:hypothetical protein
MKFHDFVIVNTDFYTNEKAYVIDMRYIEYISEKRDGKSKEYLVQLYNYDYRRWVNEDDLITFEEYYSTKVEE